jgi:OOP family OmpA-OmpF porin
VRASPLILVLFAGAALAQTGPFERDIDLLPTKASPALDRGIALDGTHMLPKGAWAAGFMLDFADGLMSLKLGDDKLGNLVPYRLDAHLVGAYALFDRLELAADLPVALNQGDHFELLRAQGFPEPGVSSAGLGDIRFEARGTPYPKPLPLGIGLVGALEVRAPTGDGKSFLGDRAWVVAPRVAIDRAFGPVRLLGNLGLRFRLPAQYLNLYVGNELTMGAGVVVSLPDWRALHEPQVVAEMHLATPLSAPFTFSQADSLKTPWEVLAGVRARVHGPWSAEFDVGRGVTTDPGYGRETFRVMAAIRYSIGPSAKPATPVPSGPPGDRDGDGVPDNLDLCPDQPGTPDLDGCPDRDGDQVPDNEDECPDEYGPAENAGCPETGPQVELSGDKIKIRGNIQFETGEAEIQRQSYPLLDAVAKLMKEHPEVGAVRVEGHTDNRGSRAINVDLSARRARAVVNYLEEKGIPNRRLRAKGYGFDKPIASNDTALGRAKNRRVEFTIIGAGEK